MPKPDQLLGKLVRIKSGPHRNQTGIALGPHPNTHDGFRYIVGHVSAENPRRVVAVYPNQLETIQY